MYSVIVVEDSKPINRDIVQKIKMSNFPIDRIEIAYDGDSALHLLKASKPDILFTDIKLPIMDGLTLIQKAKSMYSSLKCVIISGYDDFEYTNKALKLQVDDYLLKPVKFRNFKEVLHRLIDEVDRTAFLKQVEIISGILQNNRMNYAETDLPLRYMFSVARVGITPDCSEILMKNEIYEAMDLPAFDGVWVVDTKINNEKVILFDLNRHPEDQIKRWNEAIFQTLRKKHALLNMICSDKLSGIDQLNVQYAELSHQLSNRMVLNRSGMYFSNEVLSHRLSLFKLSEEMRVFQTRMENVMRSKSLRHFQSELGRCMRVWDEHCYPVAYVKKMLLIIFGIIARMDISIQVMLEDPNIWVNRILSDCKNYHDLEQKMSEQYELWINDQCIKPGSHKEIADQIEKYLRLHIYGNLTMQDIADEFKLSASYISRIMKKYYNISPIEYYNKLKIVEAKRLITEHQEMLIKEIAEILGFYDQHYFSKVFKKYHGLSPLEYKYGPELRKNGS